MSKRLEEIRDIAISGRYADALTALEAIIAGQPHHVEALRLKGNVLELKALDRAQYRAQKLLRSRDYVTARKRMRQSGLLAMLFSAVAFCRGCQKVRIEIRLALREHRCTNRVGSLSTIPNAFAYSRSSGLVQLPARGRRATGSQRSASAAARAAIARLIASMSASVND